MLIIAKKRSELDLCAFMHIYEEMQSKPRLWNAMYAYLQEDFFRVDGAFCGMWEEAGVLVSGLRMEPYRDGLLLESLETAPKYRGKGYAVKLVSQVLDTLMPGSVVYAHIHKKNEASIRTHLKCGFEYDKPCAAFIDGSVDYYSATYRYKKK